MGSKDIQQYSFRADLHCHSTCSDGTCTPQEIVDLAVQSNLQALSITDHDCMDAYPAIIEYARSRNILMVSGIEFSAFHGEASVHLLGYGFDLDSPDMQRLCKQHIERRRERNLQILINLKSLGMPITEAELEKESHANKIIGRPHIALAMLSKGYVASLQEAFVKYIGENRPAYAPGKKISVEETISTIHAGGGCAILAHPHLIHNGSLLTQLLQLPFDGLECFYGKYPPATHERWVAIAKRRNWLITGGSDFHGTIKPAIHLGASWTPEDSFNDIKSGQWKKRQ